jgi:hypothetical protein
LEANGPCGIYSHSVRIASKGVAKANASYGDYAEFDKSSYGETVPPSLFKTGGTNIDPFRKGF